MALMTFDMANRTRHIMTRIEGYAGAYEKYKADSDEGKEVKELNVDLTNEK